MVVGGPHASAVPHDVLRAGPDYLVRGEGEATIPLLLSALKEGRTGVIEWQARPELTDSPVPRFDLLNLNDYVSMAIQTSRGCPFDCEFCDIVSLFGRKMRHKAPGRLSRNWKSSFAWDGAARYLLVTITLLGVASTRWQFSRP